MLLSLTLSLLAVAPGQASLLASHAPSHPTSARLLAQADAPVAAPGASASEDAAREERLARLHLRLEEVDGALAAGTPWPTHSRMLALGGGVLMLSSLSILTSVLFPFNRLIEDSTTRGLLALSTALFGLPLLISAVVTADQAEEQERIRLMAERLDLKRQLRAARASGTTQEAMRGQPAVMVPVVAMAF